MAVRDAAAPVGHQREHMPCLDGLRGLAAVMVVLGHAPEFGFDPIVRGSGSHYGVLIFFALSGFLMGDLYLAGRFSPAAVRTYLASRVARIVPIYYLVVVVSFLAFHFVDTSFVYDVTPVQLIRLLTFNGSTSLFWSVGPEVQFYVLFVLIWLAYDRIKTVGLWMSLVVAVSVCCLITIRHWPGVLVLSKLHIFSCGMLLAVVRMRWMRRSAPGLVLAAHAACLVVLLLFMTSNAFSGLLGQTRFDRATDPAFSSFYGSPLRTILAGMVILSFAYTSPIGLAIFANPVATLLGRCSFSIYLLHDAIYDLARKSRVLDGIDARLGTLLVLAATVLLALLSYRWVEAPSRHWLRDRVLRIPLPWSPRPAGAPA